MNHIGKCKVCPPSLTIPSSRATVQWCHILELHIIGQLIHHWTLADHRIIIDTSLDNDQHINGQWTTLAHRQTIYLLSLGSKRHTTRKDAPADAVLIFLGTQFTFL